MEDILKHGFAFVAASIFGLSLAIIGIGMLIIEELKEIKDELSSRNNDNKEGKNSEY